MAKTTGGEWTLLCLTPANMRSVLTHLGIHDLRRLSGTSSVIMEACRPTLSKRFKVFGDLSKSVKTRTDTIINGANMSVSTSKKLMSNRILGVDYLSSNILDMQYYILEFLDNKSLIMLSKTCCTQRLNVAHHVKGVAYRVIGTFGIDARSFRRVMRTTNSVISGSAALLMLSPGAFVPHDLDLYVPRDKAERTIALIEEISDYRLILIKPTKGEYNIKNIHRVFYLHSRKYNRQINIIVSQTNNALNPIFSFDGTHPMNFMSAHGITCAYPSLTLNNCSLLNWEGLLPADSMVWWREKWLARGYMIRRTLRWWAEYNEHSCRIDGSCPLTVRSIYDAHTMFLDFPRAQRSQLPRVSNRIIYSRGANMVWGLKGPCQWQGQSSGGFTTQTDVE